MVREIKMELCGKGIVTFLIIISIQGLCCCTATNCAKLKNCESHDNGPRIIVKKRVTPIMFVRNQVGNESCTNAQDDFPNLFTTEQRKSGAIIVAFLIGIYCFTLLAIICDNYFLPCVERICETLSLSQDVAAATFMAMATSAPELFVNIVGTFITQSDIGIGTVVGSSMFNTLGVAAVGSLAASSPIQVDWWPVTRDCSIYVIAISLLVVMTWDGMIFWYEGLVLFVVYFLYFTIMFNNNRISALVKNLVKKYGSKPAVSSDNPDKYSVYYIEEFQNSYRESNEIKSLELERKPSTIKSVVCRFDEPIQYYSEKTDFEIVKDEPATAIKEEVSQFSRLFILPNGINAKAFFFYSWPIKFLLCCAIPNPKTRPRLFPITFVVCILFIGANSYMISWMITIIGHTFGISDSVLGLTFLAGGACLPEAVSIIIMSRKGEGSMGVSNALGANTMNILLSLGLPWFIKTMLLEDGGESAYIVITSGSLEYTILGLMLVAFALFLTLYFSKFRLERRTGIALTVTYLVFLSVAIVSEMLFVQTQPC